MTNRVKDYRRQTGITQSALAKATQIGQATISEIENNKYIPRVDTAIRIARALNTTVENLFIVDD
jgi:putative transcriptional regulator